MVQCGQDGLDWSMKKWSNVPEEKFPFVVKGVFKSVGFVDCLRV